MKQALAVRGFKGGTRENIEWSQWVRSEKERLSVVMECYGIEWGTKAPTTSTCLCWTKKGAKGERGWRSGNGQVKKESQMEEWGRRLKELAPVVKNMECLVADFSVDPEEILPEAGTLESAKSYREKKAKFLLAKIVQELRSLYHKYIELKGKFDRRL